MKQAIRPAAGAIAFAAIAVAVVWAGAASAPAWAQAVSTFGTAHSVSCYRAAEAGADDRNAITDCSFALAYEALAAETRAATHVNRGVLYLRRKDVENALRDFAHALALRPSLAEANVNRGAALILKGDYTDAVAALTAGLEAGPKDPHEAHYNRALALEQLDDYASAYKDLRTALDLKPGWPEAERELARYSVRPK
jgi:tetratricopeptide (TPR) repeat protein